MKTDVSDHPGFVQSEKKNACEWPEEFTGAGFTKEQIEAAIGHLGRGASIRGEALTLEEFAELANYLSDQIA